MDKQVAVDESARADEIEYHGVHQVLPELAYKRLGMVNVMYFGLPGSKQWVLIDAGLPATAPMIIAAAEARFGKAVPPVAIVLTHGHVDHVGGLESLAEKWDVPIYAHAEEKPFLDGTESYPPPDPTVGGGIMSSLSMLFPRGPFDFSRWLRTLPEDGAVPGMPAWRWIRTPGHTPGHVSLWRDADRTIIAGDAFITTKQESAYAVATQRPELHGPPMYFTPDWESAKTSVEKLAALQPELAVTGHGRALQGPEMRRALDTLARDFDSVAVPAHGRYVTPRGVPGPSRELSNSRVRAGPRDPLHCIIANKDTDVIEGFEFVHGDRKFSCCVEGEKSAPRGAWWWFRVSSDDRHRYAPFQALASDTKASVKSRIVAYYEDLLARRAAPAPSYWRRGAPNKPGQPATAAATPTPES